MSTKITININSKWLFKNLDPTENQYLVFENGDMRLITVFDDIGMVDKLWQPSVGPSDCVEDIYSWKVEPQFVSIVVGYYNNIQRFNIIVNIKTNTLTLKSGGISFDHGFVWEMTDIELNSDMSWSLDDTTVDGEATFDWREVQIISNVSKSLSLIHISEPTRPY